MLRFLSQEATRRRRKGRRQQRPEMTLKSYLLQEAEAASREAKIKEMAGRAGARIVSLQHDGVAIAGDTAGLAEALSQAAAAACGYEVPVVVERIESNFDVVD